MELRKKVIYGAALFFSVVYLIWRALYTLPWSESLFAVIFGVLLLISEGVSNFTAMILIWSKNKAVDIEMPYLDENDYPHVDILVATHNEEPDLLYKTINACTAMDYPDKTKVHIYLSDDTNRLEVKQLAEQFAVGYIGMEGNKHAKSGNLNHALSLTDSPLVATFDADMIPYSRFLMETVPYFYDKGDREKKRKLGFVQTPQSFYNADLFQFNLFSENSIPNEQDFFSREVNVLNNAHDAAIYTGSNTLLSRQAIVDAGGFPTDTVTEDFELGMLINACGYKSLSTLEPLASGLTPTDIRSVLKQRTRWGRGVIRSVFNVKLLTNPHLTSGQKIVFLNGFLYWWSFFRRLLYIWAPVLYTVFAVRVVSTDFWILLFFWLPGYVFLHLAMRDVSSEIRPQRWGEIQETIFAPYLVIPVFLETIGIKEKAFKVTKKSSGNRRFDLLFVIPHLMMLLLSVSGLILFNYGKFGSELFYGSVISFWLLHHMLNLFYAVFFCLGRPIYRKDERFLAEEDLVIRMNEQIYRVKTTNVSEKGLMFKSDYPIYFKEDFPVHFEIQTEKYRAELTGRIVRVLRAGNGWEYGVSIERPEEQEYRQFLLIIYDRTNNYLPTKHDVWITPFDELLENLSRRLKNAKSAEKKEINKYPVMDLDEEVVLMNEKVRLISFNYVSMTFQAFKTLNIKDKLLFQYKGLDFQLELMKQNDTEYVYDFDVLNSDEVLEQPLFEEVIKEWSQLS